MRNAQGRMRNARATGFRLVHFALCLAARGESLASHRDGRRAPRARRDPPPPRLRRGLAEVRGCESVRRTKADDREYREYVREEQRRQRGCIARRTGSPTRLPRWGPRMQSDFHHGLVTKLRLKPPSNDWRLVCESSLLGGRRAAAKTASKASPAKLASFRQIQALEDV